VDWWIGGLVELSVTVSDHIGLHRHRHGIYGQWKAVTAIFLTLTPITENLFKIVSVGVKALTYAHKTLTLPISFAHKLHKIRSTLYV